MFVSILLRNPKGWRFLIVYIPSGSAFSRHQDDFCVELGYLRLVETAILWQVGGFGGSGSSVGSSFGYDISSHDTCNNPHEPINFWSIKIPLDQFLVDWARINKSKSWLDRLISRRDCLVVEIPSLDSFVESYIVCWVFIKLDEIFWEQDESQRQRIFCWNII